MNSLPFLIALATALSPSVHSAIVQSNNSVTACEGGRAELSCPPNTVISVKLANYGRFSARLCLDFSEEDADYEVPTEMCLNPKTLPQLQQRCDGRSSCIFNVDSTTLEDVCPHMKKYLEFTYQCVKQETTTSTTTTTTTTSTPSTSTTADDGDQIRKEIDSEEVLTSLPCPSITSHGVTFPESKIRHVVERSCPEGSRGVSTWRCMENGQWAAHGPNTTGCVSDWTKIRGDAFDEYVNDQDTTGIPEVLRSLSSDTRRPMVAGDLPKVMDLLDEVFDQVENAPWARPIQKIANGLLVEIGNHLIKSPTWHQFNDAQKKNLATRILLRLEEAISSRSDGLLQAENFVQPLVFAEISGSVKSMMTVNGNDYFVFPSLAVWSGEDNKIDSVSVPREALDKAGESAQVYFASVDRLGRDMKPTAAEVASASTPTMSPSSTPDRRVVSRIVAASVIVKGHVKRTHLLSKPLYINFYHSPDDVKQMTGPLCSWWDTDRHEWSQSGCQLQSHNLTNTICECSHMTHFAVLMDVKGRELSDFDEQMLTFITYAGCTISIICLLLAFICFALFSNDGGDRVFIHKNLCLTLALAELVFLLGIMRTDDRTLCGGIAASLLYLFLSALVWMLLEGYQLYHMLVEVFPSTHSKKLIFTLVGYGVPAAVVCTAYWYDVTGFGTSRHCWLRTDNLFIGFFVAPAALILAVNTALLIMTLCIVYKHSNGGYLPCRHDSDSGRNVRSWVKGACALMCLLGVTWTCGLLWIDDGHSILMAYAFTITNSLQGLFIFIFHVLCNDKMRRDARRWFARHGCGCLSGDETAKTRSHQAIMSPSNGSGSGSGTASDFMYPTSEKSHRSSPRGLYADQTYNPHHHALMLDYEKQLAQNSTYDYATIAYGDMMPPGTLNRPYRMTSVSLNGSIVGPSMTLPPGTGIPDYRAFCGAAYGTAPDGSLHQYHRPPPEFSPPPPPPANYPTGYHHDEGYAPQQPIPRALYYAAAARRSPSSKMSDDSAYSDGGSSLLTTEVTPSGATVLRMDLSKNPPLYCHDL